MQVTSPAGNTVHTLKGTSGDKFEFKAPRSGMYKFCFQNSYATPETVSFYIHVGHIPNEHNLAKDGMFNFFCQYFLLVIFLYLIAISIYFIILSAIANDMTPLIVKIYIACWTILVQLTCLRHIYIIDFLFVTEHLDPINVKIAELREALESVTAEQKYLKARDTRHRHSKPFSFLSSGDSELMWSNHFWMLFSGNIWSLPLTQNLKWQSPEI